MAENRKGNDSQSWPEKSVCTNCGRAFSNGKCKQCCCETSEWVQFDPVTGQLKGKFEKVICY